MGYDSMAVATGLRGHTSQGRSFAFPNSKGLPSFSCEERPAGSGPAFTEGDGTLSFPLQEGLRFFRHPLPARVSAGLAAGFPGRVSGTRSGLPCSAPMTRTGKTLSLDRKPCVPVSPIHGGIAGFVPFWPRPVSIFGLSRSHDPCDSSHAFVLSVQPSPRTA
jgi:hypothetical protein